MMERKEMIEKGAMAAHLRWCVVEDDPELTKGSPEWKADRRKKGCMGPKEADMNIAIRVIDAIFPPPSDEDQADIEIAEASIRELMESSLERGMEDAAAGRTVERGSFAEFLDEDDEDDDDDEGGSDVREPRNPLPSAPSEHVMANVY